MTVATIIRDLQPADVLEVNLQCCQQLEPDVIDAAWGARVASNGEAWTAEQDGKIIGCGGLLRLHAGHALAWVLLSEPLGAALIPITRHARRAIAASPCPRIEALVRADWPEALEWAVLLGMSEVAVLRQWGPLGTPHVLFERVKAPQQEGSAA